MKTLFLTAKKFAIDESAQKITLKHIKAALDALEIVDNKAKELITEYLNHSPNPEAKITAKDIESAQKYKTINFDDEVLKFKEHMEQNDYNIVSIVSKVFIEKSNSLQALKANIQQLEENLKSKIFGQDHAIEAVCDKIVESSYNIASETPKAIYFFLGPPATGKTMLAKLMGEELEGYDAFKVFDMTQYSSSKDGFGLFGLEKGYTDATEGKLTSFVKENPKSIVVFDEIEKTHPDVLSNFLMMLSAGKAVDGFTGESIDFGQTIVVFTSNLGSELYNNAEFVRMMQENPTEANSTIIEAIGRETRIIDGQDRKAISPELLSRLSQGQIVLFNKLPFSALLEIVKTKVLEVQTNFEREFGLSVEYNSFSGVLALILLSFTPQMDVRKIKSRLPLMLFDRITDFIRRDERVLRKIVFTLDAASQEFIETQLLSLGLEDQKAFLHTLFRKNETFSYVTETTYDNGVLNFSFQDMNKKKLSRSKDFGGEEGLVFQVPNISFTNVAGHKVAKKRLLEIINILKDPQRIMEYGVDAPKGMLLYGVPGTGKTMLAKAFANEADLPFIQTTGSEILDIELMKNIFKKAREYAPSIVFIDEIDAIGKRNGSGIDIRINQLLTEINGFSDNPLEQVFIIAATNLKEKIDDAILRSGRIDLHVEIDALDREAREFFVDKILQKPTTGEFDKEKLLTYTAGMTGADLEKVARESSLYVFRNNLEAITQEIVIEQINTIKYGTRLLRNNIEDELASTAIHEAGHAVVSQLLMPQIRIEQITVTPRANALGFVSYDRESMLGNMSRDEFKNKICVAFAGREAQLKAYGAEGMDTGASNDLQMATRYAYAAIAYYGMDDELGYLNIEGATEDFAKSQIEKRVQVWLKECETITKELIANNWEKIEKLAKTLEAQEVVNEQELIKLMA